VNPRLLKWGLPLLIVLSGVVVMALLVHSRPAAVKEEKKDPGALVRFVEVKKGTGQTVVTGSGTVRSAREITVIPQVSGRVEYVNPSFVAGGFFGKGDLLFRIEDADYRLAVEQAKAKKAAAEYDISVTESRALIARSEWERLQKDGDAEPNPLALYQPQLKNARAALASAEASLAQAQLDLERTGIRAPFSALVREESVEPGQYVRVGNPVAVLAGVGTAEIVVSLSPDEMGWLNIPKQASGGKGSPATVTADIGGERHRWKGYIVRSLREVDAETRMARIVVAVEDPYSLSSGKRRMPLQIGSFVGVVLEGKKLPDVVSIPRTAYREGSTVWVMDNEDKLRIRQVQAVRVERERVFVGGGLEGNERVVVTTLTGAADGMKLRPAEEEAR
jgi:RND family efflux transporter MFP subunit